ncbi:hypothetical protein ACFV9C_19770 [Kribbella sp. NPDC059898]|uniref:hypothetical protein n=1 Tax=Kribbella sp. NPDC059898 TaxID=3346995 RepID=UPI00365D0B4A
MKARGVAGAVLLFTLAACGGSTKSGTPAPTSAPSSGPSTAAPSTTPPSSTASSTTATPTPAVPAAKDGQNYKACVDGACEVLVRAKALIDLNGDKFTATVAKGTLKLTDSHGYISLSRTGSSSSRTGNGSVGGVAGGLAAVQWNDGNGPVHIATLTYAEGDTVIVRFRKG